MNKECLKHGIKLGDRAEAVRAARALHDHSDGGVGDPRRAAGQQGVRRQQLRADDRLRPPEDGGDDGLDVVRSGGVCRRAGAQVRHQRRAAGAQRSGPDVRHDLDSRVGRVSLHDVRARLSRLLQPGSVHLSRGSDARDRAQHDQLRQPRAEGGAHLRRSAARSIKARAAGTGPDVLDVVSPVLVG